MALKDKKHGLIVVSAPSGAGKSTLCVRLLKEYSDRLALSISTTSRSPRGVEQHGIEYFFTGKEDFAEKIARDAFAEWAQVHDNYYGTSKQTLEDFWNAGKHVLLDIDVQGAESLRQAYPERCLTVFIAPPSIEVLEQRLRGRGTDSEETIQKRMKNAVGELKEQSKFDLIIVNNALEDAYQQLNKAVTGFMNSLEGGTWQKHP